MKVVCLPRLEILRTVIPGAEGAHNGVVVRTGRHVRLAVNIVIQNRRKGINIASLQEIQAEEEFEPSLVGVVKELSDCALGPRCSRLADVQGKSIEAQSLGLVDVKLCMAASFCDPTNLLLRKGVSVLFLCKGGGGICEVELAM